MKIVYKPAEELIILEMVECTTTQLAETSALIMNAGRPIVLNWAEGIVFHHSPLPFNTKDLLKERQNGRIYWASVIYAPMPEYQPKLRVGPMDIPVVETPNLLLKRAALWIKQQIKQD
jgi:hypothetical protein